MLHGVDKLHRTSAILEHHARAVCHRRHYVTRASNAQNIAVLGGGISGLAAAYYITQRLPKAKVTLFEASDRIGGWLLSTRVQVSGGSVLFEAGPRSLRTPQNGILAVRLVDELKLKDDTIFTPTTSAAANHRYLYYPDRLVRMPHPSFGLLNIAKTLLTEPIFNGVISGAIREPFIKVRPSQLEDESIGDFFSRRFGRPLVDNLLSGVIHGIYAGDVYKLSVRSLFPKPWKAELEAESVLLGAALMQRDGVSISKREADFIQEMQSHDLDKELGNAFKHTSVYTFKDGIGMLVDRLARTLWESGSVEMRTSTKVSSMQLSEESAGVDIGVVGEDGTQRFDHVISALSPAHLNTLISSPGDRIPEIPTVTVMTVNLFFKQRQFIPPGPDARSLGFGYLIPRSTPFEQNPERALGVVFDHAYSAPKITTQSEDQPTVAQDVLDQEGTKVTVMLGGHWWNDWPAYPDEQEGLKMARAVLERHLGITQEPEAYQVNLQRDCIPQYTVGHQDRLATAHDNLWRAYKGKVRVAGSWIWGVGVNDCLRSAYEVVRRLEDEDGTGLEHVRDNTTMRVKFLPRT